MAHISRQSFNNLSNYKKAHGVEGRPSSRWRVSIITILASICILQSYLLWFSHYQPASTPSEAPTGLTPATPQTTRCVASAERQRKEAALVSWVQRWQRHKAAAAATASSLQAACEEQDSNLQVLPATNLTAEDDNNCAPEEFNGLLSAISSSQSVCRVNASTGELLPIAATLFPPAPRVFPWEPNPHRYLLALCAYGRTSNNLFCLRRYTAFAALLNRTLIVPVVSHSPQTLQFMRLHAALDVSHWRHCTGGQRVMSLEDYLQVEQATTVDVKVWWWYPEMFLLNICKQLVHNRATPIRLLPHAELSKEEVLDNNAGWWGRITLYKQQTVGAEPLLRYCRAAPIPPYEVTLSQFLSFYGARSEPVISLGDVWMVTAPPGDPLPVHFSGGPHGPIAIAPPSPHCGVVMSPPPAVLRLVDKFIEAKLSHGYVAVHLRRGDFVAHCRKRKCGYSISQLAGCLARRLKRLWAEVVATRKTEAPVLDVSMGGVWRDVVKEGVVIDELSGEGVTLFLATDAKPYEVEQFSRILKMGIPQVNIVRHSGLGDPLERSMVEKFLCVRARAFWGSYASTFSIDIFRQRAAAGTDHCADDFICGNSLPDGKH